MLTLAASLVGLAHAECCWPDYSFMCGDDTRGDTCCGYTACSLGCCGCGPASCRSHEAHPSCSKDLKPLLSRCRSRPVPIERNLSNEGFEMYNCSAPVPVLWQLMEQWFSFPQPVDITGLSLKSAGPDFFLWYSDDEPGVRWRWSSRDLYPGHEGFHRLKEGLRTVRHLRIRWKLSSWVPEEDELLPKVTVFGCERDEAVEAEELHARVMASLSAAKPLRLLGLIFAGCLVCIVVSSGRFRRSMVHARDVQQEEMVASPVADEAVVQMAEGHSNLHSSFYRMQDA